MQPQTIQLDAFQVVGYRLEATVEEFEARHISYPGQS